MAAPSRVVDLTAFQQARAFAAHRAQWEAFHTDDTDRWHVTPGQAVRLLTAVPDTPIYDFANTLITSRGTVPQGTIGVVVTCHGEGPDAEDGELVLSCRWSGPNGLRQAVVSLNHECWVVPAPFEPQHAPPRAPHP